MFKKLIRTTLGKAGLEVSRRAPGVPVKRTSQLGALRQLVTHGIQPATVLDIGAANGTPPLYAAFPHAFHLMIEPLREFESELARVSKTLERSEIVFAAAGPESTTTQINVHPDLVGSSLLREDEDSDVNGVHREIPQVTIDELVTSRKLAGPFFVKIDAQGYELEVLRGGVDIVLPQTEALILEVSMFQFFAEGPQLADVVAALREYGFAAYDIVDLQYRPLDTALSQVDMVFCRTDGSLRSDHRYANAEQRAAQNERFRRRLGLR